MIAVVLELPAETPADAVIARIGALSPDAGAQDLATLDMLAAIRDTPGEARWQQATGILEGIQRSRLPRPMALKETWRALYGAADATGVTAPAAGLAAGGGRRGSPSVPSRAAPAGPSGPWRSAGPSRLRSWR